MMIKVTHTEGGINFKCNHCIFLIPSWRLPIRLNYKSMIASPKRQRLAERAIPADAQAAAGVVICAKIGETIKLNARPKFAQEACTAIQRDRCFVGLHLFIVQSNCLEKETVHRVNQTFFDIIYTTLDMVGPRPLHQYHDQLLYSPPLPHQVLLIQNAPQPIKNRYSLNVFRKITILLYQVSIYDHFPYLSFSVERENTLYPELQCDLYIRWSLSPHLLASLSLSPLAFELVSIVRSTQLIAISRNMNTPTLFSKLGFDAIIYVLLTHKKFSVNLYSTHWYGFNWSFYEIYILTKCHSLINKWNNLAVSVYSNTNATPTPTPNKILPANATQYHRIWIPNAKMTLPINNIIPKQTHPPK